MTFFVSPVQCHESHKDNLFHCNHFLHIGDFHSEFSKTVISVLHHNRTRGKKNTPIIDG